jgi:hypothetical protein
VSASHFKLRWIPCRAQRGPERLMSACHPAAALRQTCREVWVVSRHGLNHRAEL